MTTVNPDGQVAATWHIRVGATFKAPYIWSTGEPATPVDLTGWTARSQIRSKVNSEEVLLEMTTENGGITLDNVGNILVVIQEAGTNSLEGLKRAVFDLELVHTATGYVRNLVGGDVVIHPNVTRAV